jgi:hypothetical protein
VAAPSLYPIFLNRGVTNPPDLYPLLMERDDFVTSVIRLNFIFETNQIVRECELPLVARETNLPDVPFRWDVPATVVDYDVSEVCREQKTEARDTSHQVAEPAKTLTVGATNRTADVTTKREHSVGSRKRSVDA